MEILQLTLPIFGIIGAGYVLRWYKLVDDDWVHILNRFVYYVSLPALIVASFWDIDWLDRGTAAVLGFNTAALLVFIALLALALRSIRIDRKTKAGIFLAALVGNTIYMGFPLVGGALGTRAFSLVVGSATVHLTLGIALSIVATEFYVLRVKDWRRYARDFFTNPLIVSMAVGFVLSFVPTPVIGDSIRKMLVMLGATASPVALFALGGFLHGKFMRHHMWFAFIPVTLKLIAFPLLVLTAGYATRLTENAVTASGLIAAMPTAVTAFVVAEKYNLSKDFIANCILLSTLLSLLTLPLLLWLL